MRRSTEELLRCFYEARLNGESPLAYLHPEIEWTVPGSSSIAGSYRGHKAVQQYMVERQKLVAGTFTISIDSIIANNDFGLVVATGVATNQRQQELTWRAAGVFEFRDDLICRCTLVPLDNPVEFDRFWS